ncbi:MAG: hypothetical protein JRN26_05605 [Nitrososphaerota archaeon]|jgi:hypothetical protein|nr:hypothetical protein [Nitrososphaerota archaeon]MDG6927201.1 hypothetical protein [Nitrososphaerota archaeon]MDG6930811.1 hypothetical protein [Nitrososphaerota archaeon]MDG6932255.1 hypothetical protein [Nitrososphaerota archaeon]MDG6936340.1 hypothetical protein [Nitrososphaerota archaeon]
MTNPAWKQLERRIAKAFGTTRTPLSGSNSRMTKSDTLHNKFFIEIKYRKQIPFYKTYNETVAKAKEENKIPMVIFHEAGTKKNIVMIDLDDFVRLVKQ